MSRRNAMAQIAALPLMMAAGCRASMFDSTFSQTSSPDSYTDRVHPDSWVGQTSGCSASGCSSSVNTSRSRSTPGARSDPSQRVCTKIRHGPP